MSHILMKIIVNDRMKLLAYRVFDRVKAEPETDAKEAEPKPDAKAAIPPDMTSQIARRAYELFERQGHRDGHAARDWDQAERENPKDEPDGSRK